MILVSACLAGMHCRYDAKAKTDPEIVKLVVQGKAIPLCPECMAGLGVPRVQTELTDDGSMVLSAKAQAITKNGEDVTAAFIRGAQVALRICKERDIHKAILKDGSPSCGSTWIYDGSFGGVRREGAGIVTRLLQEAGISVEGR